MNWEKLNSWLTLLANVGDVVGLALLIYELRENRVLAETDAAVHRLNRMQEAQLEMAISDTLPAIRVKALSEGVRSLTPVELYRLQRWENTVRLRMQSDYVQYLRGYIEQETIDIVLGSAVYRLPFWKELGWEPGSRPFDEALKEAAEAQ